MRPLYLLLILLAALISCSSTLAQETTGKLEGRILGESGQPIANVRITLTGDKLQGSRTTTSFPDGYFLLSALPVGTYTVTFSHGEYRKATHAVVRVRLGRTTGMGDVVLDLVLHEAEELVVTARPLLIDHSTAATGYQFSRQEFANLPLDRDYSQMALLLPHTSKSYIADPISCGINFNGATALENRFFIDGVEATDPYWGAYGMAVPYNFVREVQIRSGAYQAEYRSALGGAVDMITRSGSNEIRGQVFGYFVDNRLTTDPRLALDDAPRGDFKSYDFGFGIGGPLQKDRLWYYAAFNPGIINEDVEIPTLDIFPDKTKSYSFAGKITWRIDARNDLVFSAVGAPSKREAVWNWADSFAPVPEVIESPDNYLLDVNNLPYVFSLEGLHELSDDVFLESSASFQDHVYEEIPSTEIGRNEPFFVDMETRTWSGGYIGDIRNDFTTLNLGLKTTYLATGHTWKGGIEFRERRGGQSGEVSMLTRYIDPDDGEMFYQWSGGSANPDLSATNRIYSAFLQDSWRLDDSLRLNLGLRWDGQQIAGSNGEVGLSILDQWQPRVGATYQPGTDGSRKIFAHFGRFYQELSGPIGDLFVEGGYIREEIFDHDPRVDPSGGMIIYQQLASAQDEIEGVDGQYFDEITLGYEQAVGRSGKVLLRGIYRTLGKGVESVLLADTLQAVGNPGFGELSEFPRMKREYKAVEIGYQLLPSDRTGLLAFYVLSRNEGNYTGLFSSDYGSPFPNLTESFDLLETTINSDGLLPNDRTHVLKLSGWYKTGFGLTIGATGWWMSGTPLTEYGFAANSTVYRTFLSERGSAGRTPAVYDLNLRFAYDLPYEQGGTRTQLVMDLMHVGSPRKAVAFDQQKYWSQDDDGNPTDPNSTYGVAKRYQPPMSVRLGLRVDF